MKKLVTLLVSVLLTTVSLSAQVTKTVHVATPGTLSTLLTDHEKQTVERIEVFGDLDHYDYYFLRELKKLQHMVLTDSYLKEIPYYHESPFRNLKTLDVSACQNLKLINSGAFYSRDIESLKLPASIDSLAPDAFMYVYHLDSLDLSTCHNLKVLPMDLFYYSNLKDVKLPSSIETIETGAFYHMIKLSTIDLSHCSKLETIEARAFQACEFLTNIKLPASLKSVGSKAFEFVAYTVSGSISIDAMTPPLAPDDICHDKEFENIKLYVPQGTIEAYKTAEGWRNFKNIVEMLPTSINPEDADKTVTVFGGQNEIIIACETPQQVDVYTLQGVRVLSQTVDGGTFNIPLSEGVYVVRVGNVSYKVQVK